VKVKNGEYKRLPGEKGSDDGEGGAGAKKKDDGEREPLLGRRDS